MAVPAHESSTSPFPPNLIRDNLRYVNRRYFLELLGMAAAETAIVYSFPSIIVPKNIAPTIPYVWLNTGLESCAGKLSFSADELMEAQRQYISGAIEALHRQESDFIKRLARTTSPLNYRGRRRHLTIGAV